MATFGVLSVGGRAVSSSSVTSSPTPVSAAADQQPEQPPTPTPPQESAFEQWLRKKAEGFKGEGVGKGFLGDLGGGGLRGFAAGIAAGFAGANTLGSVINQIPLPLYLGGGYLAWRAFLRPPAPTVPPSWWIRGGRVLFSPPALLITGFSTLVFKWVFPKTQGESVVYPILRGLLTVGEESVPSLDELGKGISDLFRNSFFDFRDRRGGTGIGGLFGNSFFDFLDGRGEPDLSDLLDLIPVWKRDP